jgi:uncharacterized membrane protein YphA (DoxX/SURF4 family)
MFPPGLPGVALLLLRVSVATALLVDNYAHRTELPGWAHAIAILISLVISVGYLTPIVAAAALALHALVWLTLGSHVDGLAVALILSLDAVALALLGPGAYSLDSRRFGRRLVVLPPS